MRPSDVLAVDKDDTILGDDGLFPGAVHFFREQRKVRRCVIATSAGEILGREGLDEIIDGCLPDEVFWGSQRLGHCFDDCNTWWYRREDGVLRRVSDDFVVPEEDMKRCEVVHGRIRELLEISSTKTLPDKESEELCALQLEYQQLQMRFVHRERPTFRVFDAVLCVDPGDEKIVTSKHFRHLRWHLGGLRPDELRLVYLGDAIDLPRPSLDPTTPCIVVAGEGRWLTRRRVHAVIEALFDGQNMPADNFDAFVNDGGSVPERVIDVTRVRHVGVYNYIEELFTVRIGSLRFAAARGLNGSRIIFEESLG